MSKRKDDFQRLELDIRSTRGGERALHFPYIFFSDIHLGDDLSRPLEFRLVLGQLSADLIGYVGDIIDGETLLKQNRADLRDPAHQEALQAIIAKARTAKSIYMPGNHDAWLRQHLLNTDVDGITIQDDLRFVDANGHRIYVRHGDEVDEELHKGKQGFWHSFGDRFIQSVQKCDRDFQTVSPKIRHLAGFAADYSFAHHIKQVLQSPILERMRAHHALKANLDSATDVDRRISGHTHIWGFYKTIANKVFMNTGSSTDHVQALVCDRNGLWAHLTFRHSGIAAITEHLDTYTIGWSEIGLKGLEPPRARLAMQKSFANVANILVRHACGAENRQKATPSGFSLDSFRPL